MELQALEITIGAKVDSALAGFAAADKALEKVGATANKVSGIVSNSSTSFDKIGASTNKIVPALKDSDTKFRQLAIGANEAADTIKSFSSVGIENVTDKLKSLGSEGTLSIQQLITAFELLREAQSKTSDLTAQKEYQVAINEVLASMNAASGGAGVLTENFSALGEKANETGSTVLDLSDRLSSISGGALKFDIPGIDEAAHQTETLAFSIDNIDKAISSLSPENIALLARDIRVLSNETEGLNADGFPKLITASERLSAALKILQTASESTLNPEQNKLYKTSLDAITNALDLAGGAFNNVSIKAAPFNGNNLKFEIKGAANTIQDAALLAGSLEKIKDAALSTEGGQAALDGLFNSLKALPETATGVDRLNVALKFLRESSGVSLDPTSVEKYKVAINDVINSITLANGSFGSFADKVSAFKGGVLKFDTTGIDAAKEHADKLIPSIVSVSEAANNVSPAGINNLSVSLEKLSAQGGTALEKLTAALALFQEASTKTTDPVALKIYENRINSIIALIKEATGVISSIPPAKIDIVVSQDLQAALAGFETLSVEIANLATGGVTSIGQLSTALKQLKAASLNVTDVGSIAKYGIAIEKVTGEVTRLKTAEISGGSATSLLSDKLNKGLSTGAIRAENTMHSLTQVVASVPFGFQGIAYSIEPLLANFKKLQVTAAATGRSFVSLLGESFTSGGGIGLALSVVSTALILFHKQIFGASEAAKEAKKANEDYEQSLKNLANSGADFLLKFKELTTVAADRNAPIEERRKAIKDLRAEYEPYLKNLSDENILTGQLGDAYSQVNQALLTKITLQAAEEKLKPILSQQLDLQIKNADLQKIINRDKLGQLSITGKQTDAEKAFSFQLKLGAEDSQRSLDKNNKQLDTLNGKFNGLFENIKNIVSKGKEIDLIGGTGGVSSAKNAIDELSKILSDLAEKKKGLDIKANIEGVDVAKEKISAIEEAIISISKIKIVAQFDDTKLKLASKAIDDLSALDKIKIIASIETDKSISTLSAELQQLKISPVIDDSKIKAIRDQISVLFKQLEKEKLTPGIDVKEIEAGEEKLRAIQNTIDAINALKVPKGATVIEKLIGDISELNLPLIQKEIRDALDKGIKTFGIKIQPEIEQPKDTHVKIIPTFSREITDFNILKAQAELLAKQLHVSIPVTFEAMNAEELKSFLKGLQDPLTEFSNNVQTLLADLSTNLLSTIGEGLGEALSGKGFQGLFDNIFQILGEGLKTLGKYVISSVIAIGSIRKAIDAAIHSLTPAGVAIGIALGISLIALGAAIEAKIPKLAHGGTIPYGYPNDTFPALLSSGETVIPFSLDKLKDYMKSNSETLVFIPEHRISGNDIVISYNRTTRKNKRTF